MEIFNLISVVLKYVEGAILTCGAICSLIAGTLGIQPALADDTVDPTDLHQHHYVGGYCEICGMVNYAEKDKLEFVIPDAYIPCEHTWDGPMCKTCGTWCDHDHFTNGICDECGLVCDHLPDEFGTCIICAENIG